MKKRKKSAKISRFSWAEYIGSLICFGVLAALPAFIYGGKDVIVESRRWIVWYVLYWALIAGIFCAVTAYQKHRVFDKPMKKLGEAARRVAEGDFSVYLEPEHSLDKIDYIDKMYEDFNKMVAELGSIETLKSDFVANVSHEIKSPLAVIQSYALALQDDNLAPQKRREYADTIALYSKKLTDLVTNILRLNKLENQVIEPKIETFDLCRQLCDCIISFEPQTEKKNIEISAELDDCAYVQADKNMLEIIWCNLLSNAVKFTEPGGKISVFQTSGEDGVTVTVADTGCGMNAETKKRIFDKFYQGDTSHSGEGNGLGLALVLKAAELTAGAVTVESEEGKGSAFTVRLPLCQRAAFKG